MEYENSKHVSGEASAAAKRIVDSLAGQGFQIAARQRDSVELLGSGMRSSQQNPLVGASKVVVRSRRREGVIEAEFDAVRRMIRTLGVVLFGMAIYFFVLFGFVIPPMALLCGLSCPYCRWPRGRFCFRRWVGCSDGGRPGRSTYCSRISAQNDPGRGHCREFVPHPRTCPGGTPPANLLDWDIARRWLRASSYVPPLCNPLPPFCKGKSQCAY
jgi:hypothetical protein